MYRKIVGTIIIIVLLLIIGCEKYDLIKKEDLKHQIITPFPEKDKMQVVLYFPNKELDYLASEIREVDTTNDRIEEIVINELLKGPKKEGLTTLIPIGTKLLSFDVDEGVAYAGFSEELINENYNEKQEALLLYSIVNTINELKDVEKTQILIEGKYRKVFYDHYSIDIPLKSSNLIINKKYVSPMTSVILFYQNLQNRNYRRAMDLLNFNTEREKNYTTLRYYFQNYYGNISEFQINKYEISEYNEKLIISLDMNLQYQNGFIKKITKSYDLMYKEGQFKLNENFK